MSKLEQGVNLKDNGTFRSTYQLNENVAQGFEQAVRNGQTRLALEYAVGVIADLRRDVDSLIQATASAAVASPAEETTKPRPRAKKAEEKPAEGSAASE